AGAIERLSETAGRRIARGIDSGVAADRRHAGPNQRQARAGLILFVQVFVMSGSSSDSRQSADSLSRRHWLKGAASLAGLGALPAQAQKLTDDAQVTDAPHSLRTQERVSCWGEHQAG